MRLSAYLMAFGFACIAVARLQGHDQPHKPAPQHKRKVYSHRHDPMPGLSFHRLRVVATSYCPSPGMGKHTATGSHPRRGVAAVDPNVIPLGSIIVWNGHTYLAQDVDDESGYVVDLWNDDCHQSVVWGRRPITILVGYA